MSFRITEEYVAASLDLEAAGYVWNPGPGDWLLDRDDQSIGIITCSIENPERIRRLNTHLPTFAQVNEMLDRAGVRLEVGPRAVFSLEGETLLEVEPEVFRADEALHRLRALVEYHRRCGSAGG